MKKCKIKNEDQRLREPRQFVSHTEFCILHWFRRVSAVQPGGDVTLIV